MTKKRFRKEWSQEDTQALVQMRAQGLSVAEIAHRLERNTVQVASKIARLKATGQLEAKGRARRKLEPAKVEFYGAAPQGMASTNSKLKLAILKDGSVSYYIEGDFESIKTLARELMQ